MICQIKDNALGKNLNDSFLTAVTQKAKSCSIFIKDSNEFLIKR